ncbi:Por secretion system C-terminal sorting domain-containing protein [Flavobacteriaceae bacterium MAR_2010_188]|nr:Por secretion system C-terminal sorting domain-containing protein [Flavobacteriaceae bacterium MAR_2010_188]
MKHIYFLFLFISAFGFSQLSPPVQAQDNLVTIDKIKIYPNPVTENYFYVSTSENLSVKIFDVLGKLVAEREITPSKKEVNVSTLNKGVYLVKLKSSKQSTTRKLIIN